MMKQKTIEREQLPYDTESLPESGIDLVSIFVAIVAEWKVGLVAFIVFTALALTYVHSLKSQYVAAATFLPQEGRTEAAGPASIFDVTGPGTLYLGLLRSRSVQDDVLDKAGLLQLWGIQDRELGRAILGGKSFFSQGLDGIMTVSVRDGDAGVAARIANAYLIGLQDLSDKMAQGQANQSRRFFDKQLDAAKAKLDDSEQALIELQERTGEVSSGAQSAAGVGNILNFRSQIDGLEVQLAILRRSEADTNPDIQRLLSQIAALRVEEQRQETGTGRIPVGAATTAANIPKVDLQLNHAQAEVASQQATVNALSGQLGDARSNATLKHPVFEVIDPAIPPEFRVWPPREQYIDASFVFAGVMALVTILFWLVIKRIWRNPEHRDSLRRLRRAF